MLKSMIGLLLALTINLQADIYKPDARFTWENSPSNGSVYGSDYDLVNNGTITYGISSPEPMEGTYWTGPFLAGSNTFFTVPLLLRTAMHNSTIYNFGGWVYKFGRVPNTYLVDANDSGGFAFLYGDNTTDRIEFRSGGSTLTYNYLGAVGGWHFILLIGTTTSRKIQLDGVIVASDAGNATIDPASNMTIMKIGQFHNVATQANVALDDWRFYSSDVSSQVLPGGGWPVMPQLQSVPSNQIFRTH